MAPQEKARARAALAEAVPAVGRNGATVFVRINAVSTGLAFDDADAACRAGAFGLFVFAGVVALTLEGGPELDGGRHARLRLRAEVTDPKTSPGEPRWFVTSPPPASS